MHGGGLRPYDTAIITRSEGRLVPWKRFAVSAGQMLQL